MMRDDVNEREHRALGGKAAKNAVLATVSIVSMAAAAQMSLFSPAFAQTADDPVLELETASPADAGEVSELVVTASRIARSGFTAPTPVTTLGEEEMELQAPTNVGDILSKLPSFRETTTPGTTGVTSNGGGRYLVDLRGLGSTRTLVLLDGHRFVPATLSGQVDLNQIPTLLISRAEVVTGGASAAWGSDAVAGVVNMILKRDLRGVEGVVQYGQSELQDNKQLRASLAAGTDFAGGRGSFIIGGDYVQNGGVGDQYTRDWGRLNYGLITNPNYATNGLPHFIISPNVHNSRLYTGGIITGGPLQGIAFGPGGEPFNYQYGQVFGNEMIGGSGADQARPIGSNLAAPITRFNVLTRGQYELTEAVKVYAEASYAWSAVGGQTGQPRDVGTLTIRRDNAYLPASIRTAMTNLNLASFPMGRQNIDFGFNQIDNQTETTRFLVGADGLLPDGWYGENWRWDAYFQTGYSRYTSNLSPNRLNANWVRSVDAVIHPTTGAVVCRSTLTDPTNGCIPTNVFGHGSARPNSYTAGSSWYLSHTAQQVYSANLQGDPLSTWAGPVSVAAGVEYRRETGNADSDPLQQVVQANGTTGLYNQSNLQPFSGKYDVYEIYGETVVPLAADVAWAESLELNAAIRRTVYSTSGPVVTWKVGASYSPISDLRFRLTRSRDIRAPNINELYGPRQQGGITNIPNRVGVSQQVLRYGGGNPDLQPEIADTWTGGVVYQPSWVPRLSISVDYYNIAINDVIDSVGHAEVARQCFSGVQALCRFIVEDANGNLVLVQAATLNLNAFETAGVDFELAYDIGLDSFVDSWRGDLGFRLLGNYVQKLVTIDEGGERDRVGQMSDNGDAQGVPHWSWNGNVTYKLDRFTADLQGRYVGGGVFNTLYTEGAGAENTINDNSVPSKFYLNLSTQYQIMDGSEGRELELFARITNLLNTEPAFVPSGALGGTNATSTSTTFYDAIGRGYTVGLRFKF